MTDDELRQLIESTARTAQANADSIAALEKNTERVSATVAHLSTNVENLKVLIERNHGIIVGQQKAMTRAFDGLNNVTSDQLDLSAKIAELERRLQRLEDQQDQ